MRELTFEERHRERKRKAEMDIIIQRISPLIKKSGIKRILEFGSGDGYQIPHLERLGILTASDIYKSERIVKNYPNVKFVECDIQNTPFKPESFDLIFSNCVLEHINDISKVSSELKRIGSSDCIYAFTVPTNIWLLLSIPAQCYNAVRRMLNMEPLPKKLERQRMGAGGIKGWQKFLPVGHGGQKNFLRCYSSFKMKNWEALFSNNGFRIIEKTPLLLYAPSEFPIIPTTRFLNGRGLYSSALFILKKGA